MRIHLKGLAIAASLVALAAAGSASAQDSSISYNAAVSSDYVFRGISQTNGDPAASVGIDATVGGIYVGSWASNVDFGDSTEYELDFYGGYRTEIAGFAVDVGVVAYLYIDEPADVVYDYVETKVAASRAVGPITAGVAAYYSPNFFGVDGEAAYVEANAAYAVSDKLTVSGALGKQFLDESIDYVTYNVGASYLLTSNLVGDLRYHDTDYDTGGIVNDRVVATLKVLF